MWICENCGQENSDLAVACRRCGQEKPTSAESGAGGKSPIRASARPSLAVPVLLSILLIVGVGLAWLKEEGTQLTGGGESVAAAQAEEGPSASEEEDPFLLARETAQAYGRKRVLAAGSQFTVGIRPDGNCEVTGRYYPDLSGWTDLIALSANLDTVAGLRADGTVLCSDARIDVSAWRNVVQIEYCAESHESNRHLVGLSASGTVLFAGTNYYGEGLVSEWRDMVDVAAGSKHTVGLRSDGTVEAVGSNACGQCEVSGWRQIVDVAASRYATYGLTADGRILVAGQYEDRNGPFVLPVPQWEDVVAILAGNDIGNGKDYVVGIRRDGTLVSNRTDYLTAAELNAFADVQSAAVSSWGYVVCTDSRGKVREAGWDVDGTRDTRDWPRLLVR